MMPDFVEVNGPFRTASQQRYPVQRYRVAAGDNVASFPDAAVDQDLKQIGTAIPYEFISWLSTLKPPDADLVDGMVVLGVYRGVTVGPEPELRHSLLAVGSTGVANRKKIGLMERSVVGISGWNVLFLNSLPHRRSPINLPHFRQLFLPVKLKCSECILIRTRGI